MRTTHFAAALAVTVLLAGGAAAQEHHDGQFNDHDRQVTQSWYSQHQKHAPAGLRTTDRFPADQDSRLRAGQPYDRDMERHSHSVPRDLRRQLAPAPRYHKYVAIGGHVALVDTVHHVVRDVIRLTDDDNQHRH
jgi:Ni/Co efflux regulator RcnB